MFTEIQSILTCSDHLHFYISTFQCYSDRFSQGVTTAPPPQERAGRYNRRRLADDYVDNGK
jgi:hypothetical protein